MNKDRAKEGVGPHGVLQGYRLGGLGPSRAGTPAAGAGVCLMSSPPRKLPHSVP